MDEGGEFSANAVKAWLAKVGVKTLFIEPGSSWENGYTESFFGKLRDELPNREIFNTPFEAQVLIEPWRRHYIHRRPHPSLGLSAASTRRHLAGPIAGHPLRFAIAPRVSGWPKRSVQGRGLPAPALPVDVAELQQAEDEDEDHR